MTVKDAWIRPAAQGNNAVVNFRMQNHSAGADELAGVCSDVAEAVETDETTMDGDVMQMQQVTSIPVKGKESIELAPGGVHIMPV